MNATDESRPDQREQVEPVSSPSVDPEESAIAQAGRLATFDNLILSLRKTKNAGAHDAAEVLSKARTELADGKLDVGAIRCCLNAAKDLIAAANLGPEIAEAARQVFYAFNIDWPRLYTPQHLRDEE